MFALLWLGCTQPTLQPVVEAQAAAIAEDATEGLRLAVGGAALVASVCGDNQDEWRRRAGQALTVDAVVGQLLGRSDAGQVSFNSATGLARVTWTEDAEGVRLELVVDRPQTSFVLREVLGADTGMALKPLELTLNTDGCLEGPQVSVSGRLDEPRMPASIGTAQVLSYSVGALSPAAGSLEWQDADIRGRMLDTDDATALVDWTWSGVAEGADWTWPVELPLLDQ